VRGALATGRTGIRHLFAAPAARFATRGGRPKCQRTGPARPDLDGTVREKRAPADATSPVDPQPPVCFDVSARGVDVDRPIWGRTCGTSSAAWGPTARPVGGGGASLAGRRVDLRTQAPAQFFRAGHPVRIRRSNTSWPMCTSPGVGPPLVYGRRPCRWPIGPPETRPATLSCGQGVPRRGRMVAARRRCRRTGAIRFSPQSHDLSLWLPPSGCRRLRSAPWGWRPGAAHGDGVFWRGTVE